jgi:uncharacterized protein YkwD
MKKLAIFLLMILAVANVFAQSADELAILDALNKYREANRLPKVSYSKGISKAARHHATYLSLCREKNIFEDNHDENNRHSNWASYSFDKRCSLLGKSGYEVYGEIQWQGGPIEIDSKEIVDGFHGSPPHREIMRIKKSKLVGIGNVGGCTVIVFGNEF